MNFSQFLGILRQSIVRYVTDISKLGYDLTDKTEILPVLESISECVLARCWFKSWIFFSISGFFGKNFQPLGSPGI